MCEIQWISVRFLPHTVNIGSSGHHHWFERCHFWSLTSLTIVHHNFGLFEVCKCLYKCCVGDRESRHFNTQYDCVFMAETDNKADFGFDLIMESLNAIIEGWADWTKYSHMSHHLLISYQEMISKKINNNNILFTRFWFVKHNLKINYALTALMWIKMVSRCFDHMHLINLSSAGLQTSRRT